MNLHPYVRILGGEEVGATGFENNFPDSDGRPRRFLIDDGVEVRERDRGKSHYPPSGKLDGVAITHGHEDHMANLPITMIENPGIPVWMSHPTIFQSSITFEDTVKVVKRKLAQEKGNPLLRSFYRNFQRGMRYLHEDSIREMEELQKTEIFPGVFLIAGSSGHLLGASWFVLEIHLPNGKVVRVGFSGDMTKQNRPTVKGVDLREFPQEQLDLLFLDATSGARNVPELATEEDKMAQDVWRYLAEGRKVFISALSKGRSPDIAAFLALRGIDVYVEGLGKATVELSLGNDGWWCSHDVDLGFVVEEPSLENDFFRSYWSGQGRIKMVDTPKQREWLLESKEGKAILAPSGMYTGGWIVEYAQKSLPDPDARFMITSFQAEGTPGRDLLTAAHNGQKEIQLEDRRGKRISVKVARPPDVYNWSGHLGGSENVEVVNFLRPKGVVLVHGDTVSRRDLKTLLLERNFSGRVLIPQRGDVIEL